VGYIKGEGTLLQISSQSKKSCGEEGCGGGGGVAVQLIGVAVIMIYLARQPAGVPILQKGWRGGGRGQFSEKTPPCPGE
jgi:uncharacterized spore protein YtfJ